MQSDDPRVVILDPPTRDLTGWWKQTGSEAMGQPHCYKNGPFPSQIVALCGNRKFWTYNPCMKNAGLPGGSMQRPVERDLKCPECSRLEAHNG